MTEKEIETLRANVCKRLSQRTGCSIESANEIIQVMKKSFSCEGALLYTLSDNLEREGY